MKLRLHIKEKCPGIVVFEVWSDDCYSGTLVLLKGQFDVLTEWLSLGKRENEFVVTQEEEQ